MNVFLCDSSPCSFFTAVFDAFREKDCILTSDKNLQLTFDSRIILVEENFEKSQRIQKAIEKYDREALSDVLFALHSGKESKEQTIFGYIKILLNKKASVKKAYNLPEVVEFNELLYEITGEIHRIKGLLRFTECASGVLYAPYSPDNDITESLMPHFTARFKSEKFIIHDTARKIAGVYNGSETMICRISENEIYISENEKIIETLWKRYYNFVNIKERPHEKQMKKSMPVRYWKYLPEKNL